MTEPLSPAAQAVLDAANSACMYRPDRDDTRLAAAAALRAAADLVVPELTQTPWGPMVQTKMPARGIRAQLLAIATELEQQ